MSFLRQLFGPSQAEVWKRLAEETSGEFVDSGLFGKKKVVVKVREWTIVLDTYTVSSGEDRATYTRMRAPYINKDDFRFYIYRSNFLLEFAKKKIGLQDIEIGDPQFDREFIVNSNSSEKIKALLGHAKLRELISAQPRFGFEVKNDEGIFGPSFPEGVDELCFRVAGVIKDVEQLKSLFVLFALTLNCLCHMGSAYENDPQLDIK